MLDTRGSLASVCGRRISHWKRFDRIISGSKQIMQPGLNEVNPGFRYAQPRLRLLDHCQ